jgi:hypothetical protein
MFVERSVKIIDKKDKVPPKTGRVGTERGRSIDVLFLLPRLWMRMGGQHNASAAIPPERDPVAIVQKVG